MTKAKEISEFDSCFNKARDDELMFVLLERDVAAPVTIEFWCATRIRIGKNREGDAQITEARALAKSILDECERDFNDELKEALNAST